jgi:spore coat protein H
MKHLYLISLTLIFLSGGCDFATDNDLSPGINEIPVFYFYIEPENLSNLLTNKHIKYSVPLQIFLNESKYKGTIEAQGSGSRFYPKWNFEVKLADGKIFNLSNFNLSAQVGDPSMLRTMLASYAYKEMGLEVFESNHVFLMINNENKGLYYFIERIKKDFFKRRSLPVFELIKVKYGAKFTFSEPFDVREHFEKEINDDGSLHNIETLIHALDTIKSENIFTGLSKLLDIDSYLKYHAVSTIIASYDAFSNNFHLYKPFPESSYKIIPWDFDGTFNSSMGEIFYGRNEIVDKLFSNDSCFTIYKDYFLYFFQNYFNESVLFPLIDEVIAKIKTAYMFDPYLGLAGYNIDNEAQKQKNFITTRRILIEQNLGTFNFPLTNVVY